MTESGTPQLEALCALFGFLLLQLTFSVIAEQERGVRPFYMLAYVAIAVVIVVAISLIVGSVSKDRTRKAGARMHKYIYDRGTVIAGRWILAVSIILVVLFGIAGAFNVLPGQARYAPRVVRVSDYQLGGVGIPRLRLEVPLRPHHFGGRIPPEFTLDIKFEDPKLVGKWKVENVEAFMRIPNDAPQPLEKPGLHSKDGRKDGCKLTVTDALDPDGQYFLQIDLLPTSDEAAEYDRLANSGEMTAPQKTELMKALFQQREAVQGAAYSGITFSVED